MLRRALPWLIMLLVWKVTLSVVIGYRDYLPPNFQADFLLGRESYFWGTYRWAFYPHLIAGPLSLLLGSLLVNSRFRATARVWHKRLGRVQGICVLLVVAPSGLYMSFYPQAGPIAGAGLACLAIATGVCVSLGWRSAVQRKFAADERWMWRTFLLLCSAVVIRLIGGAATVAGFDALWLNPLASWLSWLGPLLVYEANRLANSRRAWLPPAFLAQPVGCHSDASCELQTHDDFQS